MKNISSFGRYYRFCFASLLITITFSAKSAESLDFSVIVTSPSNTPNSVVDAALDADCPDVVAADTSGSDELARVCNLMAGASATQISVGSKELSAKANTSSNTVTSKTPSTSSPRGVGARLAALRNSAKQVNRRSYRTKQNNHHLSKFGFNAKHLDEEGGLLSQRLSGFLSVNRVSSEQIENTTEIGYDSNSTGLLLGLDYRLKPTTFVGLATQYFKTSADLTDEGSQLDASQIGFTIYGTHFINEQLYVEGTINNSQQQLDLKRKIEFTLGTETISALATGDTSSQQLGVYFGAGYEIPLKMGFNGLISVGASYVSTSIGGYTEDNAGSLGLAIDSQNNTSLTSIINVYLSKVYSTKLGVVIPQLSATWIHETDAKEQQVATKFANDVSNTKFAFKTPQPDPNYFIIGLDLQMVLPQGRMAFVKYSNVRRLRDKSESAISAGLRMEF